MITIQTSKSIDKTSNPLAIDWEEQQEKECQATQITVINIIRQLNLTEVI